MMAPLQALIAQFVGVENTQTTPSDKGSVLQGLLKKIGS
jgi:hypothetical protein